MNKKVKEMSLVEQMELEMKKMEKDKQREKIRNILKWIKKGDFGGKYLSISIEIWL